MPLYVFYTMVRIKNDQKLKSRGGPALRRLKARTVLRCTECVLFLLFHYRARNWTFDENPFLVSS